MKKTIIFLCFIYIICPHTAESSGVGELFVSPTRIVFEGRDRSEVVTLMNQGEDTTTYRISFKQLRQKKDGSYVDIDTPKPDEKFADKLIRYSPRQVVLKPGERQSVRLMVRKPRNLADGEYRSHMLFKTVPPKSFGDDIEKADDDKVSIQLIPVYGITIPVMVRHGELLSKPSIQNITLSKDKKDLTFNLNNNGNKSLYGDIFVTFGDYVVGSIKGIAVYTPNNTRNVKVPIRFPDGVKIGIASGTLEVVFKESSKVVAKNSIYVK